MWNFSVYMSYIYVQLPYIISVADYYIYMYIYIFMSDITLLHYE